MFYFLLGELGAKGLGVHLSTIVVGAQRGSKTDGVDRANLLFNAGVSPIDTTLFPNGLI